MTPELIIFEGAPGCGQNELAAQVLRHGPGGCLLHHNAYAEDGPARLLQRYLGPLLDPPMSGIQLLYDRSWISEAVFGPIGTDTDRLGVVGRRYLERVALSHRGIVVIPFTPRDECRRRRPTISEESETTLRLSFEKYAQARELTCLETVYAAVGSRIDILLQELERLRPKANAGPGIGHWEPNQVTLLVGERAGDPRLPFIDTWLKKDGWSSWLALQLEAGRIPESSLYWINAQDPQQRWTDPEFLDELRPKRVIAFGDEAARWCGVIARVEHREIPHPQTWRRFHQAKPYPLIDLFKEKTHAQH